MASEAVQVTDLQGFPLQTAAVHALPPILVDDPRPSHSERIATSIVVIAIHLLLAYGALYFSVRNELVQLPPSLSVRLLPMLEDKKPETLPPPVKTPPPARKTPPPQPQPVLAVTKTAESPAPFVVPPQPPAPPPPPIAAAPTQAAPQGPVTAARFDADYLHNPKPSYPAISRRNSEEGKVLLRVRVSAQGTALDVDIKQSSGFARLDEAAREAVGRWRFVPAKRGDETIESSVVVPITFALE